MSNKIELWVNDLLYSLNINPYSTLLEVIREQIGLTGTKEGCGTGECGACTVLLDGIPVNSCLILAAQVNGKKVTTIEGLNNKTGLAVKNSFIENGAIQCGFCTPGMVLSATWLIENNSEISEDVIKEGLQGNLCRCTGYIKIIKAVMKAAQDLKEN